MLVCCVAATHEKDAEGERDDANNQQYWSGHLERVTADSRVARPVGYDGHDETDEEEPEREHHNDDDGGLDA